MTSHLIPAIPGNPQPVDLGHILLNLWERERARSAINISPSPTLGLGMDGEKRPKSADTHAMIRSMVRIGVCSILYIVLYANGVVLVCDPWFRFSTHSEYMYRRGREIVGCYLRAPGL